MSAKLCFVNGEKLGGMAWPRALSRSWSFGNKGVTKLELGHEEVGGFAVCDQDCYDVCPDYAVEPAERLAETRTEIALVGADDGTMIIRAAELPPLTAFYIELK